VTDDAPSVLILGATSDIAQAVARAFAAQGYSIRLAGRDLGRLQLDAQDCRLRFNVDVSVHHFDATDTASHEAFVEGLPGLPTIAICAVGFLGEQKQAEIDHNHASAIIRSNFEGPANVFAMLARRMEARGSGILVGISSVAGDRGRASNYVYGAAKAGFTAFLSGLRQRLVGSGVRVITIKPGYVRTRMTKDMNLPQPLTAEPDEVGHAIVRACRRAGNVVYVRPIWRWIMTVVRSIPEPIFKRLRL
jgi:decaprenylphospho-beta-D-erythro-pentofuranosid-2-ulose 2-reductase